MRHVKAERYYWIDEAHNRPDQCEYTFKRPAPNRVYVRILRFVESHPKCKRRDIREAIWGKDAGRGQCSTTFANMLYRDILDYNERFEYTVTKKGKDILLAVDKMKGNDNDCAGSN